MLEDKYKVRLSDLSKVYHNYDDCGVSAIRLIYLNGKLDVEVLCHDDCEPYWNYAGTFDCSLVNWAIILTKICNMSFIKSNGEPYKVICQWEWFNEEE